MATNSRISARLASFARFFRPGFLIWLDENWHIYQRFELQALDLIGKGWEHFSARTIVEEIRHYTRHAERGSDAAFKVNGNWVPDLGRVFTICYPEHAGLWEYRRPDWREFLAHIEQSKKGRGRRA
jgi:hypothetical protein